MRGDGVVGVILSILVRVQVIIALLAGVVVVTEPRADRYGDNLQIALPLLALLCEANANRGAEFLLRYGVMFTAAHASKRALGDADINQRPNGGGHGFPSAHTSTAVLGASALVHGCLRANPIAQAVVLVGAGFVGSSRIEAGAHDIWQVLAGALLGLTCDRALRRQTPARARVAAALRATGRQLRRLAAGTATLTRGLAIALWQRAACRLAELRPRAIVLRDRLAQLAVVRTLW